MEFYVFFCLISWYPIGYTVQSSESILHLFMILVMLNYSSSIYREHKDMTQEIDKYKNKGFLALLFVYHL